MHSKTKKKGSFIGVDIGTQETTRFTTQNNAYRTPDSNFVNQFRFGTETDANANITKLEINGEDKKNEAVIGLYSSLDTQTYSVFNNQKITSYNQAELNAGIIGGIKSGPIIGSGRVAVNHDQLNNIVYPTIQTRAKLGNNKNSISSQLQYSTNAGVNNPNQIVLGAKTTLPLGKTSSVSAYTTHSINLGDNVRSYKTRPTLGLTTKLGGKVEFNSEWYFGSGDNVSEKGVYTSGESDKGYLLQTVVKQNWGTIYANISKVNETQKIGAGVVAKVKNNTIMEVDYSRQRGYGEYNDADTVQLKLRNKW